MNQRTTTEAAQSFYSQFRTSLKTLNDPASAVQATLVDTGNAGVLAPAWRILDVYQVARHLVKTGAAQQGAYPYTASAHPKYYPFVHNAIGNLFEIKDFALEAADIVIRDMYWEPSEFEYEGADGAMFPSIVLCFNNYGATYDTQAPPKAYPFTAAITGLPQFQTVIKVSTRPCSRVRQASTEPVAGSTASPPFSISNPLENARPAPVKINARTSASSVTPAIASRNSTINSAFKALSFSGRFRVR